MGVVQRRLLMCVGDGAGKRRVYAPSTRVLDALHARRVHFVEACRSIVTDTKGRLSANPTAPIDAT
jgi:hypothetical protein